MVGFSELSDTDESAIEEIISQAQDACVLEQISKINCSSFTDPVLPTDLESRFRKLKSFPVTKPKQRSTAPPPPYEAKGSTFSGSTINSEKTEPEKNFPSDEQSPNISPSKESPDGNTRLDPIIQSGYVSSPSNSVDFSPVKEKSYGKKDVKAKSKHGSLSPLSDEGKRSKQKSKSGSLSSLLSSSNSLRDSPSPPRKGGCLWCSPKKDSKKKSKENWDAAKVLGWDNSDELLSDLGSFSIKHHQKMLKKALKEEEKIGREAEKIVQWAKQASARMSISSIEDELSDH